MHFQFLIEDQSGAALMDTIMKKHINLRPTQTISFGIRSYRGIGGFVKGDNAINVKSVKLLNDLPKRIRAFNAEFRDRTDVALFIVLDNDTRDTNAFRHDLETLAARQAISIDYVFCIAVEEMEAWLLGDVTALIAAYPAFSDRILTKHANYIQDAILPDGTWEFLADLLTKRGMVQFRKENPTFVDIGRCKSEWAENIGRHMDIRNNSSPSFQHLMNEIDRRLGFAV